MKLWTKAGNLISALYHGLYLNPTCVRTKHGPLRGMVRVCASMRKGLSSSRV